MDLEMEGFSATQRTFIGPDMQALEINACDIIRGNEANEPELCGFVDSNALGHNSGQCPVVRHRVDDCPVR
jgi:hypothetical protein